MVVYVTTLRSRFLLFSSQAAIVKGAALRGLEGVRPTNTIARYHYGWSWALPFRDGIDDEEHSYICGFSNVKLCSGRMHWPIRKVSSHAS
jgi:hypothetical protein